MAKAGRNDPCPCGSGKKYKNCCLRKERQIQSQRVQYLAAEEDLHHRLVEYATQPFLHSEMDQAMSQFWEGRYARLDELDESQTMQFLDWYIHDYRLSSTGERPIERYAAERGQYLPPLEQQMLQDWQHSLPGAYDVVAVRPGEGSTFRDVIQGDVYDIADIASSHQLVPWDIIVTRILRVGDRYVLSGGGVRLPSRERPRLVAYLNDLYANYREEYPTAGWDDFLRDHSHLLHQYVEAMYERPRPTIVTMEGDEMRFGKAFFDVLDYPAAVEWLKETVELEVEEDEPGIWTASWREDGASLELLRAHGPAFDYQEPVGPGVRSLGHIELRQDELVLEVTSERRMAAGKALLEARLGTSIRHRGDEWQEGSIWDQLPEEEEPQAPERRLPPDVEQELYLQAMRAHYHRWVDEEIPALDYRTPREMVRTPAGRDRVLALIRDMANLEARNRQAGRPWYDMSELLELLGLEEANLEQMPLWGPAEEGRLADLLDEISEHVARWELEPALEDYRRFMKRYGNFTMEELDFGEYWDLPEMLDDAISELAHRLNLHGYHDEAIAAVQHMVQIDPENEHHWRERIAEYTIDQGDVEDGFAQLRQLAEEDPADGSFHAVMAEKCYDLGCYEEGIEHGRRAWDLARESDDEETADHAWYDLMRLYRATGQVDQAVALWEEATRLPPFKNTLPHQLIEILLEAGDTRRARQYVPRFHKPIDRYYYKGRILRLEGQDDQALRAWQRVVKTTLEEIDVSMWGAEWAEAAVYLGQAARVPPLLLPELDIVPGNWQMRVWLGIAYAVLGQVEEAHRWLKAALPSRGTVAHPAKSLPHRYWIALQELVPDPEMCMQFKEYFEESERHADRTPA